MGDVELVSLSGLDGFGFQKLVARVFARLGYGVVKVSKTMDAGKDVELLGPNGEKVIIECKHWPNGIVGRPVVQKLHSAVMASGASLGIIVTSGKFSDEAREYASSVRPKIELYDRTGFWSLALKAGIIIVDALEKVAFTFILVAPEVVVDEAIQELSSRKIISYPSNPLELIYTRHVKTWLYPFYHIRYSVYDVIPIRGGKDSYVIEAGGELLLNAYRGDFYMDERLLKLIQRYHIPLKELDEVDAQVAECRLSWDSVRDKVVRRIIKDNTRTIYYVGGNNVGYSRTVRPKPSSIDIRDVRLLYVPFYRIEVKALSSSYNMDFAGNGEELKILKDETSVCRICGKLLHGMLLLCNACGNITHPPKLFGGEGFRCKECGKTICKNCTYTIKYMLFLKKKLCPTCYRQKYSNNH